MATDFRASQVQTNKIIASGSTGTGAKLLVYGIGASSTAQPNQGVIDASVFNTSSIGSDVFLFVSGTLSSGSSTDGISTFGGSVRVSGVLTVGAGPVHVTGSTIIFFNPPYDSLSYTPGVNGVLIANADVPDASFVSTGQGTNPLNLLVRGASATVSGAGGAVQLQGGSGGANSEIGWSSNGGAVNITGGSGGTADGVATAGTGGDVILSAGAAGTPTNDTNARGGNVAMYAGVGSSAGTSTAGNGGAIIIVAGAPGDATADAGAITMDGGYTSTLDQLYTSGSRFDIGATNKIRKFIVNATSDRDTAGHVADDIFFFVSGTVTASQYKSVAVFGGDLVVSGVLMSTLTKTFVPIGSYTATAATASNAEVAGQAYLSTSEVPSRNIVLRTILSTTDAAVTSSIQLWNITSGSFVHIGGAGITELTTVSTTPVMLTSSNLLTATNFTTGSAIYEVRVYIATGSAQTIHGSSMFVCGA